MKLQHFIDRPILSMVISVVIFVAGLIGLYALSVEQYPDIAPPTIRVSTTYSGANAEAVQKSVIVPLEEAINGVENMTYMTSTASNTGSAEITVYFIFYLPYSVCIPIQFAYSYYADCFRVWRLREALSLHVQSLPISTMGINWRRCWLLWVLLTVLHLYWHLLLVV